MGRPLNKRLFGAPTAGGNEIKINFHNGTAVKEGYIVKQVGSKKFVCEEIGTAGEYTCTLTTGKLPAALAAGEMAISFKMDDEETYTVSKISGRKATLSAPSATGDNIYENIRKITLSTTGPLILKVSVSYLICRFSIQFSICWVLSDFIYVL